MSEAERKEAYKNIVYRLKIINSKIVELNTNVVSMKNMINKNILINNECYKINIINNINNSLNGTYSNIYNNIKSLNKKIYN